MAEKKRNKRQIRLQDFEKNAEGKYEYRGTTYRFSGDFAYFMKRSWTLMVLIIIAVISGGLLPATGAMDTWYVLIPYGITVGAAGFCCYRLIQWSGGKGVIREYNYAKSVRGLPMSVKVLIWAASTTFFLELFYLVSNGMGDYPLGAVVLLISTAITVILAMVLERLISLQSWEKQEV